MTYARRSGLNFLGGVAGRHAVGDAIAKACRLAAGAPRGVLVILTSLLLSLDAVEFTTAGAVRDLLPAQAAERHPVRLTGVVTYYRSDKLPDFILQDATGGVHVRQPKEGALTLAPGDEVEIEGVTDAAVYAPRVDAKTVRRLGRSEPPLPIPVSAEELAAGYHEGWLVEVAAVVRAAFIDATIDPPRLVLRLGTPAGSVDALVTRFGADEPARYLDAAIRVRGVSLRQANRRNEPYRWLVFVHTVDDIVVTRPPPADPFSVPLTPLSALLAGGPQGSRHRLHVQGVVTFADDLLVIQDGATGLSVLPRDALTAVPGDAVEVVGFARIGMYNPVLEQALVRVTGHPGEPAPEVPDLAKLKAKELAERDWRLITITGTAGAPSQRDARAGFSLRVESYQVPVHLPAGMPAPATGTQVRVTGVCDLAPGRDVILLSNAPTSFSLLMRSAADLVVVKSAPWWTRERMVSVLASLALALLLALAWGLTLRRRVDQRTRELAAEIRARHDTRVAFDATTNERRRLAGELHDSLEQELTGVALQLDAGVMALPSPPPPALSIARQLLAHSRAEVRRAVWDLNASAGEEADLAARLKAVAAQLIAAQSAAGHPARVEVAIAGTPLPVPGLVAHHLTRIVQEAAHNALRHGQAQLVTVAVAFASERLELIISDDGSGFDIAVAAGPGAGHFGVQGMHERARKIGAELTLTSAPGAGTRLTVGVPLPITANGQP